MDKKYITIIVLFFISLTFAQNVGIGTTTPNSNAVLDVYSNTKGLLPTRNELIQTDAPNPLTDHVEGMITYNIFESGTYTVTSVHDGLYYNDGSSWNLLGPNAITFGDLKYSLITSDHGGWYLLDGRAISSLPVKAQNNALSIGLATTLVNASDSFLKTTLNTESIGTIAGGNTIVLSQSNLPNVTFTGTTNTTGNHNHLYSDEHSPIQTLGLATNVLGLVPLINVIVGQPELYPSNNYSTNNEGNHSHTASINSGGTNVSINATPEHIVTNLFIYLGE